MRIILTVAFVFGCFLSAVNGKPKWFIVDTKDDEKVGQPPIPKAVDYQNCPDGFTQQNLPNRGCRPARPTIGIGIRQATTQYPYNDGVDSFLRMQGRR